MMDSYFRWKLRHLHTTHYIVGRNGTVHCGHCGDVYSPKPGKNKEKK